jgi:HK97 family phage major capsid protein
VPEEITLSKESYDELATAVSLLTETVMDYKKGAVDRQSVEQVVENLMDARERAQARGGQRRSFSHDGDGSYAGPVSARLQSTNSRERIDEIRSLPAGLVAPIIGRPVDDVQRWQAAGDELLLMSAYLEKDPRELRYFRDEYQPLIQAMDTATVAEGLEYVPRELSASLIERVNLQLMVALLFPSIVMPSNPFDIPGLSVNRGHVGKAVEQTADTGQTGFRKITAATRKVTLNAMKFGVETLASKDLEEDALIAILPFLQAEIVDYMAGDLEDAIVNGDTAGAIDTGWTATIDPRLNFDGLRKTLIAGSKTDGAAAALTPAMLRVNRKKMGRYGIRATEIAHVISMGSYISLLADPTIQTLEKYGVQATVLTGELAKIDGVPIVVSEFVRNDLNLTGVFDNVTTTRTVALTVSRKGFLLGERRGLTVQVMRELYAEFDQDAIIATARRAFSPRFPTATEPIVASTYNLLP